MQEELGFAAVQCSAVFSSQSTAVKSHPPVVSGLET